MTDSPTLRLERHLRHPVDRVWRAVTEPAELERWFVVPVPWTPALGERFEAQGLTATITELDPPHRVAWTWGQVRYAFDLAPDGDGCRLVFTHVVDLGYGPPAQHARGWDVYLHRLAVHLDGGQVTEDEAHARVAGPFTLADGPELRLERPYFHPVQRLWRALTEPEDLAGWFPSGAPLEVTDAEPPRWLEGTWHGERLRFELRPDGPEACVLVFMHAFDDRDTSARTAAGWDRCLVRLDGLLAGHPLDEAASLAGWPQVHEGYAEKFGVDPELGRRAYAEHR